MNTDYNRCRALYRAAGMQECASQADRNAVRLALTTAVTAGVHAATVGASAAAPAMAGISAAGSKGFLQLVLGGKFISGLLVGAALGTAGFATSVAVQSREVAAHRQAPAPRSLAARDGRITARDALNAGLDKTVNDTVTSAPNHTANGALRAPPTQLEDTASATRHALETSPNPLRTVAPGAAATRANQPRLAEETAALANIQDALNQSNGALALLLIEEQSRSFAGGQLGEERAAAKVLALCGAGRVAEAETARTAFIAAHANSPLTKRVTLGCSAQ